MINATNGANLSLQKNLFKVNSQLNNTFQRLSSGNKLNKASDDAALTAISEALEKELRGLEQGTRNGLDGMSMLQVADSAAGQQGDILQRMRELSSQAANGTLSDEQRGYLQEEFTQLRDQFNQIATTTEFNGQQLLDGSGSATTSILTSDDTSASINVDFSNDFTSAGVGINALDLSTQAGAQSAMSTIDTAMDTVTGNRSTFGAAVNRIEAAVDSNRKAAVATAETKAIISETDFASETANLVKNQTIQDFSLAMKAQAANANQNSVLSLLR